MVSMSLYLMDRLVLLLIRILTLPLLLPSTILMYLLLQMLLDAVPRTKASCATIPCHTVEELLLLANPSAILLSNSVESLLLTSVFIIVPPVPLLAARITLSHAQPLDLLQLATAMLTLFLSSILDPKLEVPPLSLFR